MTELLYQTDSYLQAFQARVVGVNAEERSLVLDRSAFYPGGGGQPADRGTLVINGFSYSVQRAKKAGQEVYHYLDDDQPLPMVGAEAHGQIDWDRRYRLMRTHTAMHILCGVIFRDYGASVTGGDMDPLKGRMDFEFETMQKDLVQEIDAAINTEVKNARSVQVKILPRDEAFQIPDLIRTKINLLPEGIQQVRVAILPRDEAFRIPDLIRTKINLLPPEISHVRTLELVGLDLQADGGTHVRNTSEVGRIRVVDYKSKGKINKRIYIELE
jgi:misacylated tRNA(Ala) deacylase